MEIFKSNFIKTSTTAHQRRSPASAAKLRLLDNPTTAPTDDQEKKPSDSSYLSVRFKGNWNGAKDTLTEQQLQPMMVRNFLDATKRQLVNQPAKTMLAQANSAADVVTSLLA